MPCTVYYGFKYHRKSVLVMSGVSLVWLVQYTCPFVHPFTSAVSFSYFGWQDVKIQLLTSVVSRELLSGEFMSMSLLSREAMIHFRSRSHRYMMYDQLLWKTTDREVTVIVECRSQTCYTLIWVYWYKPSVYPGCYHDCHMKLVVLTRYWTLWLVQLRTGLSTLEKQQCLPSAFHRISSMEEGRPMSMFGLSVWSLNLKAHSSVPLARDKLWI